MACGWWKGENVARKAWCLIGSERMSLKYLCASLTYLNLLFALSNNICPVVNCQVLNCSRPFFLLMFVHCWNLYLFEVRVGKCSICDFFLHLGDSHGWESPLHVHFVFCSSSLAQQETKSWYLSQYWNGAMVQADLVQWYKLILAYYLLGGGERLHTWWLQNQVYVEGVGEDWWGERGCEITDQTLFPT